MVKVISRRSLLLIVLDLAVIYGAFLLAGFFFRGAWDWRVHSSFFGLICLAYIFAFYIFDYYSPFRHFQAMRTLVEAFFIVVMTMAFFAIIFYFAPSISVSRRVFFGANLFIYVGTALVRLLYTDLLGSRVLQWRAIVVGGGPWLKEIIGLITKTRQSGIEVVGIVSSHKDMDLSGLEGIRVLGPVEDAGEIARKFRAGVVILAMDEKTREKENEISAKLYEDRIKILSAVNLYEKLTGKVPFHFFRGGQLMAIAEQGRDSYYFAFKRILDVLCGFLIGLALFPIVLVAMILLSIEFKSFSRVIFLQERVGRNGCPFKMYKLRTMMDGPDGEKTVTRVGRWVRKYRIDEVPQLINVLKGDMSLIGPRPEMARFVSYCRENIPFYDVVFSVRPGLTGWAQVKFAHTTRMEDYQTKFCYDLYYLKHCTMVLDGLIFFETIKTVFFGRGK